MYTYLINVLLTYVNTISLTEVNSDTIAAAYKLIYILSIYNGVQRVEIHYKAGGRRRFSGLVIDKTVIFKGFSSMFT